MYGVGERGTVTNRRHLRGAIDVAPRRLAGSFRVVHRPLMGDELRRWSPWMIPGWPP